MRNALRASAVLSLAACTAGEEAAPAPEKEERERGSYEVDAETGEINARVLKEDGSVATMRSGETVPVDLPAGFTVYPGAQVISNTRVDHGEGAGVLLAMQSADEPGELSAFYRRQAAHARIEIDAEMEAGGTAMFAGKGPGGLVFSFNVSQESTATVAQLMVGTGTD